jgi:hypothetical protein
MTEFLTKSGAKVVVNVAPWQDARRLKSAIEREISLSGIKFDLGALKLQEIDLKADAMPVLQAVGVPLMEMLMRVDSCDAVDEAMWPCLARCTRNGNKIIPSVFDTAEGRADYYDILAACIVENFRPLIESLLSQLPAGLIGKKKATESAPEQK